MHCHDAIFYQNLPIFYRIYFSGILLKISRGAYWDKVGPLPGLKSVKYQTRLGIKGSSPRCPDGDGRGGENTNPETVADRKFAARTKKKSQKCGKIARNFLDKTQRDGSPNYVNGPKMDDDFYF